VFIGQNSGKNSAYSSNSVFIGNDVNNNVVGSDAVAIGAYAQAGNCGIALGCGACSPPSHLSLGSATAPLTLLPGGSLSYSACSLAVFVNGACYKIPLLSTI